MNVYVSAVAPSLNPGALWVRICAGDELVAEHALGDELGSEFYDVEYVGLADVDAAVRAADRFGEARVFIYDGDSGECIKTIVLHPPSAPP